MRTLTLTISLLDRLAEVCGRLSAVFAPTMLLVTCYIVVSRYIFNAGSVAIQDLVTYCNALVFCLGAGYTLKHDAHVRVDIFYSRAAPRTKALVNLVGTFLLLLPVTVFILWACWSYVATAWAIREGSPEAGGLPYVYLLKTLILVLGVLLVAQGLAEALRCALFLAGRRNDAESPHPSRIEEDDLL